MNYQQLYAKKKVAENRLRNACSQITNESGCYIFKRYENGLKFAYIGQAKHLLDRCVSHLLGYSQRVDISLKKRGLYPKGEWELIIVKCSVEELDNKERELIKHYADNHFELYNITSGGQGEGKVDINQRESGKTYTEGLKVGYQNCLRDVREFFTKYLDYSIKEPKYNKNGKINAIKSKKLAEWKEIIST